MRFHGRCAVFFVLLGSGASACAGEFASDWRIENQLGFTRPGGPAGQAFGPGFDLGWSLGRRLFADVMGEATVSLGTTGYSNSGLVTTQVCTVVVRGLPLCSQEPVKQRGQLTEWGAGLSKVIWARPGQALALGIGGLGQRAAVSPAGQAIGLRRGGGAYARLRADLVPLGAVATVGVAASAAVVRMHGQSLGAALPARATDRWWDVSAFVAIGRGRRDRS